MKKLLLTATLLVATTTAWGQMFPERRDVRKGNREYERENYVEAEAAYMGALSKNPASYEGNFNLGTSLYRQGRYEEAAQRFQQGAQLPNYPGVMAQTHYNQGNALVQQYKTTYDRKKLEEALETYKQSLRFNPEDREAKFNLAYVQKLLERDNDGGGGGGGNDQNNQDQNNDQNDQNQNGGDNQNDQNPDQNNDQNNDPDNNGQNQENQGNPQNNPDQPGQPPRMSKEEAEQMLNAMQNGEEGAKEKMEGQPVKAVGRSGKNW